MKTILSTALAALLFCAPAFADQAPETPLFTGPNMQQTPASQILIKVPGSTIQTLGAALAASGCTTNCALTTPTITGGSIAGAAVAATSLSNGGQNLSQFLGAPYRQPTANDDVTRGNYPSMVWRSNNSTWVNISNGQGQAVWQKVEQLPLPGDAIGLYVSAAAVNAGGAGYVTGNTVTLEGGVVLTVTAASGVVTGVTVTTPNMYGVCSPTTTAAPQLVTSGTGTGFTANLTILYPTIYAVRRVSSCFTGSLLEVENSVTTQTKNIGYLADNSMDFATALAFGTGGAQMEQYANYNDGPTPNVAIWYDQGGNPSPNNASQATVAQQPVLFAGRHFGNSVAVLFPSQGGAGGGYPFPSVTSLAIPSGVTLNSANAALFVGGGDVSGNNLPLLTMAPVGGVSADVFALVDNNLGPLCTNQNTGGTSYTNGNLAPDITETPGVYGCMWSGGILQADSTYLPVPYSNYSISGFVAQSTQSVTLNAGTNCPVTASHTLSLTASAGEAYPAYTKRLVAAVNADSIFQSAGLTASLSLINPNYIIALYQPVGAACTITTATVGSGSFSPTNAGSGGGWSFAGGSIGSGAYSNSGYQYHGIDIIVPWAMTAAQAQRVRQSINYHFGLDGHVGVLVTTLTASNLTGYLTPFVQDLSNEIVKLLGRDDVVVINKSIVGESYVTSTQPNFFTSFNLSNPLTFLTSGKSSNNIGILYGEANSLTTTGSSTTEYNAVQTIAGYYQAAGWSTICGASYQANFTATQSSETTLMQGLFNSTPGACTKIVNPQALPVFDVVYPGPWMWPYFVKFSVGGQTGTHPSAMSNALQGTIAAEAIRGMVQ